ncbi:ABC transporter ATP-binding protein [Brevibacillus massiliensis]|jgi:peptide/nickel transport system ATP-binding protein/oligopeptide transport system ATP-binding protein|uniref:ABC transporter ATP-binding protein n=1 Tax=Brevibacillus massiliensis TaxID=1118054 RepID=UPI0002D81D95|nr:dipeptide ABC transporter ATP-binding protein [Brevibacillus massiliensis]
MNKTLLEVKDLTKYYPIRGGLFQRNKQYVKAVDGVTFSIREGETFGLVGESGCGKSTTGRSILRLIEPTSGKVYFDGREITKLNHQELRNIRKDMQIIFQDPYASLNPRMTIGKMMEEPMIVHGISDKSLRRQKVREMLEVVGLNAEHGDRYPHEFSGGQRQRVGIARALMHQPKLIVADEPVSALDVSVQSQVLNLLQDLQETFRLTYLFISHDLSVVRYICDRIGVMYLGRMVELGERDALYDRPLHPYTQALLSAAPIPDPEALRERIVLQGDVPNPANPPVGCAFHPRCPYAVETCRTTRPAFREAESGRFVACHLYETGGEPVA